METKNIVTIDFDIIMAPSIEIYNAFVNEEMGINDFAEYRNALLGFCNANLAIYTSLSFYIFRMFEQLDKTQIHFVYDHDQVYDYIKPEETYNIFNIDHHHDCGYPSANPELYCGNWVLKIKENKQLNDYIWITDEFSGDIPENMGEKIMLDDFDLYSMPNPDIFVICLSQAWVPSQFFPLFDLWVDFYNVYFNEGEPLSLELNSRKK